MDDRLDLAVATALEGEISNEPRADRLHEWEFDFVDGQRVPINGWWFIVRGTVRSQPPLGALVLEPTGERTPFRQKRRH